MGWRFSCLFIKETCQLGTGRATQLILDQVSPTGQLLCSLPQKEFYKPYPHSGIWCFDNQNLLMVYVSNCCFWTVVLEKTLESPLDCTEIQLVHPKGNQSWIFIGRTDAEAETPILWPSDAKNWLIWKDPDAGKDWRQEKKGMTEDEVVRWHNGLDGHEFE